MSASPDPDPAAADGGAPPLDDDANVQTSDATAGTQLVAHGDAQAIAESMAEASPKEIDIPMANVDKGINGIARYIVVVITGDGRRWAISKRFSDFYDLKMELAMLETHLKNGMLVRDLAFPPKQLWGGSGDEVISTRIPALRRWVNNVLKLAPESRDFEALMSMFLAEDHSVDQRTLRLIGLNEDRLMSTGRASAGAAPRQLVPTEYEDGEYDVLNHPDKSHSITPRARYSSEGALKAAGLGIGRLGSNAGAHLVMRPKVETQVLGVIHDYEIGDIVNRMDVLEGIDNALGFTGPPDLEFIFREDVRGAVQTLVPIGFGHAAIRYRVPWTGDKFLGRRYNKTLRTAEHGGIGQDKQYIVNITRGRGASSIVEMWECPEDYILGAGGGKNGIFTNSMCSVRIQKVDQDSLKAIHHYFVALGNGSQTRNQQKQTSNSQVLNFVKFVVGEMAPTGVEVVSGSGSQYIAQVLFGAGLVDRTHAMPKAVWVDLFERQIVDGRAGKNAAVVYYKQAESGMHRIQGNYKHRWWWPWGGPRGQRYKIVRSLVSVFQVFRNYAYWDMERFADVIVTVDDSALVGLSEPDGRGGRRPSPNAQRTANGLPASEPDGQGGRRNTVEAIEEAMVKIKAFITYVPNPVRPSQATRKFLTTVHTFAIVGICAAWMLFGRPRVTDRHAAGFGRLLLAYWFVRLNRLLY